MTRIEECKRELKNILKPGDTVFTVLRYCSASGMTRRIDLYAIKKSRLVYLSSYTANLTGNKLSRDGGIVISGCGMDMGFALVYELASRLWPKGTRKTHAGPARDGGYALRQEWI